MIVSAATAQSAPPTEIQRLLDESASLELVDAMRGIAAAEKARDLAIAHGAHAEQAWALIRLGRHLTSVARFSEGRAALDAAIKVSEDHDVRATRTAAIVSLAACQTRRGYLPDAGAQLRHVADGLPDATKEIQLEAELISGRLDVYGGRTAQGVPKLFRVDSDPAIRSFPRLRVALACTLGMMAVRQGIEHRGFRLAYAYTDEAFRLIEKHGLRGAAATAHYVRGYADQFANDYSDARARFESARAAAAAFGDPLGVADALRGLGAHYKYAEEWDLALSSMRRAGEIATDVDCLIARAHAAVGTAGIIRYRATKTDGALSPESARQIRDILEPLEESITRDIQMARLSTYFRFDLGRALAALGEHERAYELTFLAGDTERWLASNESFAGLALRELENEQRRALDKARGERELLEAQRAHDAVVRNGSLVAATIFALMALVLFRLFVSHRRAHAEVAEQRERLEVVNTELTDALSQVKSLSGLIPICASCKSVRDDEGYWQRIEQYLSEHSEALFSHGICPQCVDKLYPEYRNGNGTHDAGHGDRLLGESDAAAEA